MRRGLTASRTDAATAIAAGRVLVNGAAASKAAHQVHGGDAIVITGDPPRFVSRGGDKLDAALDAFAVDVAGRRALDAGASTGGFTDCLLQRGAARVVAVDVGHGQLHPRIRDDPRVVVFERMHVKDLDAATLGGPVELIVADLSFISLTRAIAPLLRIAAPGADLVLLVKPQFEAGREEVSRGKGVITDPAVHDRVRGEIDAALRSSGCTVVAWVESPITGGSGNREFLVHAVAPREGCEPMVHQ